MYTNQKNTLEAWRLSPEQPIVEFDEDALGQIFQIIYTGERHLSNLRVTTKKAQNAVLQWGELKREGEVEFRDASEDAPEV
jgi:hypothetical protein